MTNLKTAFGLTAAIALATTALISAGEVKTYHANGNFIRVTDGTLLLRTKTMDLELIRDAKTKVEGKITKGVAASVTYDKINGQPHATEIAVKQGSSTVIN